ncbi:MAG: hypothetical protein WKG52_02820 [Variovorax sp.]
MGKVFTFVAAAALGAAAPVLVAGRAATFNGLFEDGFLAAETAGFFELGIRPRTTRWTNGIWRQQPGAGGNTWERRGRGNRSGNSSF